MRVYVLSFALLFSPLVCNAIKIPTKRIRNVDSSLQKRSGSLSYSRPNVLATADDGVNLLNMHDLIYLANITMGGHDYPVQLDTGSSDLWLKGPQFPLPNAKPTSLSYNLTYGIGWAYGNVSYIPVQFAGISISSQAYLDISQANNPALSYGADGIVGLGFTSLSTVDALVNQTDASSGRSLLFNAFQDNPNEPNFIAFSLQRNSDTNDEEGIFSIGEVEPAYASIMDTASIPTFPPQSPSRWSLLMDAFLVGTNVVSLSTTVSGAPLNKAVALVDTGTSYSYVSTDVANAIYGGVPGAKLDTSLGQWVVPCDAEINIAIQIGGRPFAIHPLDVSPPSLTDPTTCVGSFVPGSVAVGAGAFDVLIGDNVLRSLYAIYDFGDFDSSGKMGDPYFKLLSIVDPNQASKEFHQVRGGSPQSNITYNAANTTTSGNLGTSVNISDELANTINKINNYLPVMLAVMALNALVIVLLLVAAIIYLLNRRKRKNRRLLPRSSPIPRQRTTTFDMPTTPGPHVYQPISMALTDDTFVPPSPAFAKPGSSPSPVMGARPNSVA